MKSFFGRSWKLRIHPQSGEEIVVSNSSWETEALRCTFVIDQVALATWWCADICVYNSKPALSAVLQRGDLITLEAGYQAPGSGLIFQGQLFQAVVESDTDVDYVLRLHCLVGMFEDHNGDVSVSFAAGLTPDAQIRQVAAAAVPQIDIEHLDPALSQMPPLPRGKSYSGPATGFFARAAAEANMNMWMSWNGLNIRSLANEADTPNLVYAPPFASTSQSNTSDGLTKYTLIGTPQQTENGVNFSVLLDSELQLGALVKIESVLARRILQQPMQFQRFYDPNGLYVVAGIRHTGDTRGNAWYSEITGVSRAFDQLRKGIFLNG